MNNGQLNTGKEPLAVREAPANYHAMLESLHVRTGYKQTEVGVIPEDWEAANLGDKVQKVGSGITPTGGERVYMKEGRPFLRSQNVGWGYLLLDDMAFIEETTHESFQSTEIAIDDVFLNITGASIGRSAVADSRVAGGNVNQHVCIIRTNQGQLHPRFLNYFLLSQLGQQQIDSFQAGGNRQGLNFGQIRSFQLPVPHISEQRAIAAALSDVDALLASLDKFIAKKRDLKQAAMQQLLTGERRLPGFGVGARFIAPFIAPNPDGDAINQGAINRAPTDVPHGWEVKQIGDVAPLQRGFDLPNPQLKPGPYPVVYSNGVLNYHAVFQVRCPGVVTGRSGTIGKVNFIEQDYWPHNTTLWVTSFKGNDPKFVFYLFTRIGLDRFATGSGVPTLNRNDVHAFKIRIPTAIDEQTAIASVLSDMDAEIASLEARRDKTRALKQGMMQELLTGRIRLV
jgi:type I restriction enzyme S subunit